MISIKACCFLILWIAVIIGGISLGTWQLDRRAWKEQWLAQIEQAYQNPRLVIPTTPVDRTFFSRGTVFVTYDPTVIFWRKARIHQGAFGAHLYTLGMVEGRPLLINRGFVADGAPVSPPQDGPTSLMVRVPDWDITALPHQNSAIARDHPLAPVLPNVVGVVEQTRLDGPYPLAIGVRPTPPNNHLAYALFWFGMSIIAAGMGIWVVISNKNKPAQM